MAKLTKKSSKKRILQEWIAALKGEGEYKGVYKQGRGALHKIGQGRKKDTFCCLGVLCDLAVKAKVLDVPVLYGREYYYDGSTAYLSDTVREWAGMASDNGEFDFGNSQLAELNDNGKKFKTIAKIIERKPEGLFV